MKIRRRDGHEGSYSGLQPHGQHAESGENAGGQSDTQKCTGAIAGHLQGQGIEYLQVKTLSDTHPDAAYARTRAFYMAVGFRPLEEFKTLWNEENPCLLMVKSVRS